MDKEKVWGKIPMRFCRECERKIEEKYRDAKALWHEEHESYCPACQQPIAERKEE